MTLPPADPIPPPVPDPAPPASPAPAVFVAAHQDDELLSMGAAILQHVAAGREVLVLVIGRGNKSVVRTRDMPGLLGYIPSEEEFGAVRDWEFEHAVVGLGAAPIVPAYSVRLDERAFSADDVAEVIAAYAPDGSDLKTHSRAGEYNPDHVAVHDAVARLYALGWTAYEPRFYTTCTRLHLVESEGHRWRREGLATPVTLEHQGPYRETDLDRRRWGIGYRSVPYAFDAQRADPFAYRVLETTIPFDL